MREIAPSHPQLPLAFEDDERELLGLIARVALLVANDGGRVAFADRIGMSESAANHALNRTLRSDGRRMSVIAIEKLTEIVRMPGGHAIVEYLAKLVGCQLVSAPPFSEEELRVAGDQVLEQMLDRDIVRMYRTKRSNRAKANRESRLADGPEIRVVGGED